MYKSLNKTPKTITCSTSILKINIAKKKQQQESFVSVKCILLKCQFNHKKSSLNKLFTASAATACVMGGRFWQNFQNSVDCNVILRTHA